MVVMIDYFNDKLSDYKTHIKPQKPALIKPIKPSGLGFMIKPGFYANPDSKTSDIMPVLVICKYQKD